MKHLTLGGLDLAVIDPHERDTRYIYDEIFVDQIYFHPEMRLPRLSADTVPDRYRGGFAEGGRSREVVDVSALPGPMRQEVIHEHERSPSIHRHHPEMPSHAARGSRQTASRQTEAPTCGPSGVERRAGDRKTP